MASSDAVLKWKKIKSPTEKPHRAPLCKMMENSDIFHRSWTLAKVHNVRQRQSICEGVCKASSNNKYLDKNSGWVGGRLGGGVCRGGGKINRFSIHEGNGPMENLHVHIKENNPWTTRRNRATFARICFFA